MKTRGKKRVCHFTTKVHNALPILIERAPAACIQEETNPTVNDKNKR